jgi:hypothetical protein
MDKLFSLRYTMPEDGSKVVITAYDTNQTYYPHGPQHKLHATLTHNKKVIWKLGDTYCGVSPMHSIDGEDAKALVTSLFAMRPGDTDAEYFEHYTQEQLDFADKYGEDLAMLSYHRFGDR